MKYWWQVVGLKTGKVYEDQLAEKYAFHKAEEDESLKHAKKVGYLSYEKYYPQYNKSYTTEISTGKIISCLWEYQTECRWPITLQKILF